MEIQASVFCNHVVGDPPVSYTLELCPRCRGKETYRGISFTSSGTVEEITGFEYLVQRIKKILAEQKRENSAFGFNYDILRRGYNITLDSLKYVKEEVFRCLMYLKTLQEAEIASGQATYAPNEIIAEVSNIQVTINKQDPRQLDVTVDVFTQSRRQVQVNTTIGR